MGFESGRKAASKLLGSFGLGGFDPVDFHHTVARDPPLFRSKPRNLGRESYDHRSQRDEHDVSAVSNRGCAPKADGDVMARM